ncbi:cystathionine beta-lyase [Algicella marina]|uniref:Cystathionine beta-lyase n=1 Tax=Algicella marina TaxID=2683284 RepID=A0A6P1SY75_9RHOB|nr:cystathionine beta-lyase [Algicella marina]QHQ35428.1 cystathionine beta-lyase [Algicella marina]
MTSLMTQLVHSGNQNSGVRPVNPPLERASTFLFDSVHDIEAAKKCRFEPGNIFYGRLGTRNGYAFEDGVSELEGGSYSLSVPSGLAACTLPALAFATPGSRILVTDNIYDPARGSYSKFFARIGVEVVYFDPRIGEGIADLMTDNTTLVFLESPGSLTFEVQDIPAISTAAHARQALVCCDNTYATGYFHRPLELGADIVMQAATKYIVGHSDATLGVVTCKNIEAYRELKEAANWVGYSVAPDITWVAQRGLRTLPVRLEQHQANGLAIAEWCQAQPEVATVFHPGLASHTDHLLWKRDFTGASGLFAIQLETRDKTQAVTFVEALELFGLGFSWGGYESLALISDPRSCRTATSWEDDRIVVRLHAGLEQAADLTADLEQAITTAFR